MTERWRAGYEAQHRAAFRRQRVLDRIAWGVLALAALGAGWLIATG